MVLIAFQGIIVQVLSKEGRSHLVAIVKGKCFALCTKSNPESSAAVPEAEDIEGSFSPWFVFNDFSVQNISEEEALSFPGKWKVRRFNVLKVRSPVVPTVGSRHLISRASRLSRAV